MKRLNPATGKPFERGEMRADGKQFSGYQKTQRKDGYFTEMWVDAKRYNLRTCLNDSKKRAKEQNVPFDLDLEHLESIMTTHCPVFGMPFNLGRMGDGYDTKASPSLDRVIPEYGYLKGNVVFISNLANAIKQNVTETELYAVADWLHYKRKEVLNAFKNKPTPVPTGTDQQGQDESQPGTIPAPGTGEDYYDLDHYQRTVRGEDADYRTQTRGGDGVGYGVQKVGASEVFTRVEDNGQPDAEIIRLDFGGRHIPD